MLRPPVLALFISIVFLTLITSCEGCYPRHQALKHLLKADELKMNGKHDQAIAEYQAAIKLNQDSPSAFNNMATSYLSEKKWDQAISTLQEAIRLNPDMLALHFNLAVAYCNKGESQLAKVEYNRVTQAHYPPAKALSGYLQKHCP